MIAFATGPIAYVVAGPLADNLVPYLFSPKCALSPWLTSVWGTSKSGELGALFTAMGVALFLGFVYSATSKDVREVEERPI